MMNRALFSLIILLAPTYLWAKDISLAEVLGLAKSHPEVQSLSLTVEQAKTQYRGRLLNWAPNLTAERAWTGYSNSDSRTSPLEFERLSFQASLNLFNGFSDISSSRASYFALQSGKSQISDEWHEIQNQIAMIYFRCFRDQKQLDVANQALEIRRELSKIAQLKYQNGAIPRDEYIKLRIDTQLAKSELADQKQVHRSCLEELSYWIGRPQEELKQPDLIEKIEKSMNQQLGLKEHPGWKARNYLVREQDWRSKAQAGSFWPDFNVTMSKYPRTSYQIDEESVFFSVEWSLFDRGETLTNYQLAKVNEMRAERELEAYEQALRRNFKIESGKIKNNLEQYQINVENNELAQGILRSSTERFQKGAISSNEVSLDQTRVINAARAHWDSWYSVHESWLGLLDSRGVSLEGLL